MSMTGAGFVLDAIRRNAAASGGPSRLRASSFHATHDDAPPEREPFACQRLCSRCKYLGDGREACPFCGTNAWLELDLVEQTRILREVEAADRDAPPRWAVALAWLTLLAPLLVLLVLLDWPGILLALSRRGLFECVVFGVPVLACIGGLLVWFGRSAAEGLAGFYHRLAGGLDRLDRWRLPLRPVEVSTHGVVEACGEPLLSPIGRRPCVAYAITARLRRPGDRPRLVLLEHRSGALRIAGQEFPADAFAVAERPTRTAADETTLARVLRERGLSWSDGDYDVREAIISPGAEVGVRREPGPGGELSALRLGTQR